MSAKLISVLQLLMLNCLLLCLLIACGNEPDTEKTGSDAPVQEATAEASVAADYFSATEMQAIINIKDHFEKGLRLSFEKRTIDYAYIQNALRMRLNYINQDQSDMPFPFNGNFSLEEVSEDVDKLPFVSKKCGFLVSDTDEQVNYYCLGINENYFEYLKAISEENGLISSFVTMYKETKNISPGFRQRLLMDSMENLDLANWDHQLFYMFFQCWRNEELRAYSRAQIMSKQ